VARGFVEVSEECEAPVFQHRRPIFLSAIEPGYVVIDQLRDRRVLADDDKAGRGTEPALPPQMVGLLIVSVERFERRLEPGRELQRVEVSALATPLLRHVLTD